MPEAARRLAGSGRDVEPLASTLGPREASRLAGWANPTVWVWVGLLVMASGFGAIFYAWGKVAGLVNVAQQIPYVVSGGLTGLGLIIVGGVVVDVAVRRQDSAERRRQMLMMSRVLAEVRACLDGGESRQGS